MLRRLSTDSVPLGLHCAAYLLVLAAMSTGCDPEYPDPALEEKPFPQLADVRPSADWGIHLRVNVEGTEGRLVEFGEYSTYSNASVIMEGDIVLRNLERAGFNHWKAEVAAIKVGDIPGSMVDAWPVAVSFVAVDLTWDVEARVWRSIAPELEVQYWGGPFDGEYKHTGACERRFQNNQGATLYYCESPHRETFCGSDEKHFWPGTTCQRLGYDYFDLEAAMWRDSVSSNVTPGEHGWWGDRTGGGSTSSSGGAVASCTDANGVCTELLSVSSGAKSDYKLTCDRDRGTYRTSACAVRTGPACLNASMHANGTPIKVNIFYGPTFCSKFPNIDTGGACTEDFGGQKQGTHCSPP